MFNPKKLSKSIRISNFLSLAICIKSWYQIKLSNFKNRPRYRRNRVVVKKGLMLLFLKVSKFSSWTHKFQNKINSKTIQKLKIPIM
jgi:hypothetical protein